MASEVGSRAHSVAWLEPAPYTRHSIEAGGVKLNYLDYGTAGKAPMLCVHGGAAHAHWFDFVAGPFRSRYHVRALDLRGHGDSGWVDPPNYPYESYAADIAEVAEKLDLRDYVLIGHSMGGMCCLLSAATYPGRVGRLVVIDSTMHMTEERVANMHNFGAREGRSHATRDEFLARFRLRPAGTLASAEVIAHMAQVSAHQSADGRWRHKVDRNIYAKRQPINGYPLWEKIKVPALLVKGDHSQRITPEIFAEVKARCPQAGLAEVAHSDHHVTLDNPAGFVEVVGPWLGFRR
jgi:pimeloyl-ACP methyl ester carboxylesterase